MHTLLNKLGGGKCYPLFILLTAVVAITLCSYCSPLYRFNGWVDPNVFLTIGRSMLHGVMPYRDLYDQKGPLLFLMHALAALVSERSFLGVYLLELPAAWAFLHYSFKTIRLLAPRATVALVPLLAAVTYSSVSFVKGDSVEEFALPIYAYTLYVGLRAWKGKRPSRRQLTVIGALGACLFWTKFTLIGFHAAWFACMCLDQRRWKDIGAMTLALLCGALIVSVPLLAFLVIAGIFPDFLQVYFLDNLFAYPTDVNYSPLMELKVRAMHIWERLMLSAPIAVVMSTVGASAMWLLGQRRESLMLALCFVVALTGIYAGGRCYLYYALPLHAFMPIGLGAIAMLGEGTAPSRLSRWAPAATTALSLAYICIASNFRLHKTHPDGLMQQEFAQIINSRPGATMLNVGFLDLGVYTAAGIIPSERYFCKSNVHGETMQQVHDSIVEAGGVDYVVVSRIEFDHPNYRLVSTRDDNEDHTIPVHLYELIRP